MEQSKKGTCPRCDSDKLRLLFTQDRWNPSPPEYVYTWAYYECEKCNLILQEGIGKPNNSLAGTKNPMEQAIERMKNRK